MNGTLLTSRQDFDEISLHAIRTLVEFMNVEMEIKWTLTMSLDLGRGVVDCGIGVAPSHYGFSYDREARVSSKGIFAALSGSMAQGQRLDTIANNIANVNTPAFKKDQQVFREYLTAYEKTPDVIQVPKVPASIESFYDNQGGDRGYVDGSGTYTDFSQGTLKTTGNPLDFAIEGEGFFEVLSPQGVRLTRAGTFSVDATGRLVTNSGYPVLKQGEDDPQGRFITLKGANVSVSTSGEVFVDDASVGRLSIVGVGQKEALTKAGNNLFAFKDTFDPKINRNPDFKLHQGFFENSNINIVQEMTDMIAATRVFESTQRAIKAYDQMDERLVNDVPKIG